MQIRRIIDDYGVGTVKPLDSIVELLHISQRATVTGGADIFFYELSNLIEPVFAQDHIGIHL